MEKDISGFERINFRAPGPKSSIIGIVILGLVFGFLGSFFGVLSFFESFWFSWLSGFSFFVFPALFYGFFLDFCFDRSEPRRTFLMSLVNMVFLFCGLVFLGVFENFFLFLVGIIFSINVIGFAGINSRIGVLALVVPLVYFGSVFSILHFSTVFIFSVFQIGAFLGLGVGSLLLVYFVEFFFRTIVPVSAVELFSNFLNRERMSLNFGIETDVLVQGLFFESDGERFVVCVPRLHPGPLRGVGGGSLSSDLIDGLNDECEEGVSGYFWHVPSSHQVNPSDPGISDDVLDECFSKDPEYYDKCTKILETDDSQIKIYGQRFGDNYIIFLNIKEADDFKNTIFKKIREETGKKITFVDMHQLQPQKQGGLISSQEPLAGKIQQETLDLLEKLEQAEEYEIKTGVEISEDRKNMALVEEVGDEKYLILGMNRNGLPDPLREELKMFESDFDKVLSLTTDSHKTTEFLDEYDENDSPSQELVKMAEKNLEPVKIGLVESWLENVKVLGKDAYNFATAINYSVFSFPVLLALLYAVYFFVLI